MIESVLTIIAAVLPVLFEYLDRRREEKPNAERQEILSAIARNDMDDLAARVDRLRTKRRVRAK